MGQRWRLYALTNITGQKKAIGRVYFLSQDFRIGIERIQILFFALGSLKIQPIGPTLCSYSRLCFWLRACEAGWPVGYEVTRYL